MSPGPLPLPLPPREIYGTNRIFRSVPVTKPYTPHTASHTMGEEPLKHALGVIRHLDTANYARGNEECVPVLQGIMAWNIVMEEEDEQVKPENQGNFSKEAVLERKVYKEYMQRRSHAAAIICGSCVSAGKLYIKGMSDPVKVWKEVEVRMNGAASLIGRMTLFRKFRAPRPTTGNLHSTRRI